MSRAPINTLLFLGRRSYAVAAAEIPRAPTVAAALTRAAAPESNAAAKQEVFWMRDPKTGNWVPENRFGDVDVAELRAKLLSKKEQEEK